MKKIKKPPVEELVTILQTQVKDLIRARLEDSVKFGRLQGEIRHAHDVEIALHNRITKLEAEASKKKESFLVKYHKWLKG